jgi:hypothetical protein
VPARQIATFNAPGPAAAEEAAKPGLAKAEKTLSLDISQTQKVAPYSGQRPGSVQLKGAPNAALADSKSGMKRAAAGVESKLKANSQAGLMVQKSLAAGAELESTKEQTSTEGNARQPRQAQMEQRAMILSDGPVDERIAQDYVHPMLRANHQFNNSLSGAKVRGGQYGYGMVRRQVTPQSELLPGGVLTTQPDLSNVVWARLANNADLVVGPASEVLLLKPTEVRLQAGELMLNVPLGDQVDLLGPEPPSKLDSENSYRNLRRNQPQWKFPVSRLQVTGRGVFRIENSQVERVDEEPTWLTNYFVRQNTSGQNSPQLMRQASPPRGNQSNAKAKAAPNVEPADSPK